MAAYTTIDDAGSFYNTKLYSAGTAPLAITGVGFQPDITWIKSRSYGDNQNLFDSVRGATEILYTNNNNVVDTQAQSLQSWQSDGFTVGSRNDTNRSGQTFVSWNWKGGTTSGITTNGSTTITPSAYSFNQTARISILKYTGNTVAGAKIAHGLGVAPDFTIFKSTANATAWNSYHIGTYSNIPDEYSLCLSSTAAKDGDTKFWNDTVPDSVNITLGNGADANPSALCVAYCFASVQGFSNFGSYTGNGNVDGPFIYTGFRPAYIMIRTTAAGAWAIFDNKRSEYNVVDKQLAANTTEIDQTSDVLDILSNGFKIRATSNMVNGSGWEYIYSAFAEFPLVSSNSKAGTAR